MVKIGRERSITVWGKERLFSGVREMFRVKDQGSSEFSEGCCYTQLPTQLKPMLRFLGLLNITQLESRKNKSKIIYMKCGYSFLYL